MARTLQEVLKDLQEAEKEYSEKCKKYGIEEKHRKKKVEVQLDEDGNPIVETEAVEQAQETEISTENQTIEG